MNKLNDPVLTQSILDNALEKNNKVLTKTIIDEVAGIIDVFATQIDERFNKLEARMYRMEKNLDKLTITIDGFLKRLDHFETEQTARDAEVTRIKGWIEQIAAETGVKLKGFTK